MFYVKIHFNFVLPFLNKFFSVDFNEWIEDEKIDDEDADNLVYVFTFICFIILYTLLVCHGMVLSKYTEWLLQLSLSYLLNYLTVVIFKGMYNK